MANVINVQCGMEEGERQKEEKIRIRHIIQKKRKTEIKEILKKQSEKPK